MSHLGGKLGSLSQPSCQLLEVLQHSREVEVHDALARAPYSSARTPRLQVPETPFWLKPFRLKIADQLAESALETPGLPTPWLSKYNI